MADSTKYDVLKTGIALQSGAAICLVDNVNNGGTVAINGTWMGLPAETNEVKFGRIIQENPWTDRMEVEHPDDYVKGYLYESMFQQRDADSYEFDKTYAGKECILFTPLHYLRKLATPKRQYLAVFGTVRLHGGGVAGKDGKITFKFQGLPNAQAVILTATAASPKVIFPVIAGLSTPTADMTIAAFDGINGIYTVVDR